MLLETILKIKIGFYKCQSQHAIGNLIKEKLAGSDILEPHVLLFSNPGKFPPIHDQEFASLLQNMSY